MNIIKIIYKELLKRYGPQGWWPLYNAKTGRFEYHKGNYDLPKNDAQRFEIIVGAILTQNTSWKNVEKAMTELSKNKLLSKEDIKKINEKRLAKIIKSSGYNNQKAKKLKEIVKFLESGKDVNKENLLNVWGVGRETADSILLYSYNEPIFVVDVYTRRMFSKLGFFKLDENYDKIQKIFMADIPKDLKIYQEFHALIVEHCKEHYSKKPHGVNCPLLKNHKKRKL